MSFNLRFDAEVDGKNRWIHRKEQAAKAILAHEPDLLGVQECYPHQSDFLRERLPDHDFHGVALRDDMAEGEMVAIFHRRDRFEMLDRGWFALSETPDVVGSKSWDSAQPRQVLWTRLRDRAEERRGATRELVFFNTHFDHIGVRARLEAARLMRRFVAEIAGTSPAIITGDFNAPARSGPDEPYRVMLSEGASGETSLQDAYRAVHAAAHASEGTFGGYVGDKTGDRIDWILPTTHFLVLDADIDRRTYDGRYPSDHYPITARILYADEVPVPTP